MPGSKHAPAKRAKADSQAKTPNPEARPGSHPRALCHNAVRQGAQYCQGNVWKWHKEHNYHPGLWGWLQEGPGSPEDSVQLWAGDEPIMRVM